MYGGVLVTILSTKCELRTPTILGLEHHFSPFCKLEVTFNASVIILFHVRYPEVRSESN